MLLTIDERAKNAVLWHLYTHGGEAPLGEVMRINVPRVAIAVNNLRAKREVVLVPGSLKLRMVNNG